MNVGTLTRTGDLGGTQTIFVMAMFGHAHQLDIHLHSCSVACPSRGIM